MEYTCRLFQGAGRTEPDENNMEFNLYRDDEGRLYRFHDLPFGAMYVNHECRWTNCAGRERGGCLYVKVPQRADGTGDGVFWQVDHPAGGSDMPWSRFGEPPHVTASPSILYPGGYHGWLRDGLLVDA